MDWTPTYSFFEHMPNNIIDHILEYTPAEDITKVKLVSHKLYDRARLFIWKHQQTETSHMDLRIFRRQFLEISKIGTPLLSMVQNPQSDIQKWKTAYLCSAIRFNNWIIFEKCLNDQLFMDDIDLDRIYYMLYSAHPSERYIRRWEQYDIQQIDIEIYKFLGQARNGSLTYSSMKLSMSKIGVINNDVFTDKYHKNIIKSLNIDLVKQIFTNNEWNINYFSATVLSKLAKMNRFAQPEKKAQIKNMLFCVWENIRSNYNFISVQDIINHILWQTNDIDIYDKLSKYSSAGQTLCYIRALLSGDKAMYNYISKITHLFGIICNNIVSIIFTFPKFTENQKIRLIRYCHDSPNVTVTLEKLEPYKDKMSIVVFEKCLDIFTAVLDENEKISKYIEIFEILKRENSCNHKKLTEKLAVVISRLNKFDSKKVAEEYIKNWDTSDHYSYDSD